MLPRSRVNGETRLRDARVEAVGRDLVGHPRAHEQAAIVLEDVGIDDEHAGDLSWFASAIECARTDGAVCNERSAFWLSAKGGHHLSQETDDELRRSSLAAARSSSVDERPEIRRRQWAANHLNLALDAARRPPPLP